MLSDQLLNYMEILHSAEYLDPRLKLSLKDRFPERYITKSKKLKKKHKRSMEVYPFFKNVLQFGHLSD